MNPQTATLIEGFTGEVIPPGDSRYDTARSVWNAMIDRRPAIILAPRTTEDVVRAVRYARESELPISVKGGGHSAPGHGVCDDGVMIDLGLMRATAVDPVTRRARAQGGCLLQDMDAATQEHGLIVPAGAISHTGVGGLALGGGFGHLMRRFGLTVDHLVGAEVVLVDGEVVRADAAHHSDLFWALRGGSGNFGIVTEFEFACETLGPVAVTAALHPLSQAREVMQAHRAFMDADPPDEFQWISFLRTPPNFPWVPEELQDSPMLLTPLFWIGDAADGAPYLQRVIDSLPAPAAVVSGVAPFVAIQQEYDLVFDHGRRHYAKAGFLGDLPDGAIDVLIERMRSVPSRWTQIEVLRLGGAVARVPADATAFPHRAEKAPVNIIGIWEQARDDAENVAWVRDTYRALEPHMSGGAYVNYMGGEETGGAPAAYGETWARLARIKHRYDPENVLRFNANIRPAANGSGA
jgi:FAD/FMN-containing dehydrogenase